MAKYTYNPPYNQWSGNRSDTLNKWKVNYKGSIATASALPEEGEFKGDTYNVLEDGSNYMWNGTSWDKLDANTYIGATSEASGIRGLVPPATTAQMYSLLTGMGTWQSAEDLGLALDDEVVHLTGDETIEGEKVFKNEKVYSTSGNHVSNILIRNPAVERGTATNLVNNKRVYSSLHFLDNEGSEEYPYSGRLAMIEYMAPSTNDLQEYVSLCCYDYFSENKADNAELSIGYDRNRVPYARAPETSDERIEPTDIVTRGFMEASEWNWQKTKKAGAVTFKSVSESDLEPVVDFMSTEMPPAEGEKGPENPSTILGVSNVKLTRCGKNLCPIDNIFTENTTGLTISSNTTNGYVSISGTASSNGSVYIRTETGNNNFLAYSAVQRGKTYKFSLASNAPSGVALKLFIKEVGESSYAARVNITSGNSAAYTIPTYADRAMLRLDIASGTQLDCECYIQIEEGDFTTAFEPYLDNDYTIQLGNTYYGGYLNVTTGVLTVTHRYVVLDGTESFSLVDYGTYYQYRLDITDHAAPFGNALASVVTTEKCTHFEIHNSTNLSYVHAIAHSGRLDFFTSQQTVDSFKSWLASEYAAEHPVSIVYPLATPLTVQLTPVQIKSLSSLDKYEPRVNTVYTDQETVQVGYQRFYDENRLVALEARIETLEANQG